MSQIENGKKLLSIFIFFLIYGTLNIILGIRLITSGHVIWFPSYLKSVTLSKMISHLL